MSSCKQQCYDQKDACRTECRRVHDVCMNTVAECKRDNAGDAAALATCMDTSVCLTEKNKVCFKECKDQKNSCKIACAASKE